jgi:hypothetical protein
MNELTETPPASPSPLSLIPPPPPSTPAVEHKPLKLQREEARKSDTATSDRWHEIFI